MHPIISIPYAERGIKLVHKSLLKAVIETVAEHLPVDEQRSRSRQTRYSQKIAVEITPIKLLCKNNFGSWWFFGWWTLENC